MDLTEAEGELEGLTALMPKGTPSKVEKGLEGTGRKEGTDEENNEVEGVFVVEELVEKTRDPGP